MLTGDLEAFKKQSFILKEGVEYRIKISFKVREHTELPKKLKNGSNKYQQIPDKII